MIRLIGNLLFGLGWVIGRLKWRLGIIVEIPEEYRRSDGNR